MSLMFVEQIRIYIETQHIFLTGDYSKQNESEDFKYKEKNTSFNNKLKLVFFSLYFRNKAT